MEFVTVECGVRAPHDPHTWREGFLWHRKRECGGVPQKVDRFESYLYDYCAADVNATELFYEKATTAIIPANLLPAWHRHHFGFDTEASGSMLMVWKCLNPFCDEEYYRFRSLFRYQTLGINVQTIYKKQKF